MFKNRNKKKRDVININILFYIMFILQKLIIYTNDICL